jgi:DNA-binding winged helix-turn-helix (wHTH) protein
MPVIRFAQFELNEDTLQLRKSGVSIRIQQQPARILVSLINHCGSLVTREQIRLAIWGEDTFVDFEHGLNFCIRQIRLALNDNTQKPAYIETLPRLGYRFIAAIEKGGETAPHPNKKHLSIGIAAFDDLARAENGYFAAGLTEDILRYRRGSREPAHSAASLSRLGMMFQFRI